MEKNRDRIQSEKDDMRFIKFWGGKKLIFTFAALIMLGVLIMIFNHISFIFRPLQVIFSTIIAPIILAVVFFHILNPLVTWLEKKDSIELLEQPLSLWPLFYYWPMDLFY